MRVIAGKYRSRILRSLKGMELRPTTDRLRETLFNVLGPIIRDSFFVDCFAGTGAVGIEALSRGAREVIFIENHRPAVVNIRKNLDSLDIHSGVDLRFGDALAELEKLSKRKLLPDIVYLDPPYKLAEEYENILEFLDAAQLLAPEGRIIAEHTRRLELPSFLTRLERSRMIVQGDSVLSFYRLVRAA
jgi:16S rRNA (guanine(966)-N(2))-methyltransferase RsmD